MTERTTNSALETPLHDFELPSHGYRRARESGVSRLSELMFGSLLASYVLGFVAFAASAPSERGVTGFGKLLGSAIALDYLAISLTFTFLTAALYVSYQIGILTMPTIPVDRLSLDFLVALAQAVCFGFSLVLRELFPFFLSIAMGLALLRHRYESQKLLRRLTRRFERSIDDLTETRQIDAQEITERKRTSLAALKKAILDEIGNRNELVGWKGVQPGNVVAVTILFVIALGAGGVALERLSPVDSDARGLSYLHLIIHACIVSFVGVFSFKAIKRRGTLLVDLLPKNVYWGAVDPPISTPHDTQTPSLSGHALSRVDDAANTFYDSVIALQDQKLSEFKALMRR